MNRNQSKGPWGTLAIAILALFLSGAFVSWAWYSYLNTFDFIAADTSGEVILGLSINHWLTIVIQFSPTVAMFILATRVEPRSATGMAIIVFSIIVIILDAWTNLSEASARLYSTEGRRYFWQAAAILAIGAEEVAARVFSATMDLLAEFYSEVRGVPAPRWFRGASQAGRHLSGQTLAQDLAQGGRSSSQNQSSRSSRERQERRSRQGQPRQGNRS